MRHQQRIRQWNRIVTVEEVIKTAGMARMIRSPKKITFSEFRW
jgi:hypothetical protein